MSLPADWSLLAVELAACGWILLTLAADLLLSGARKRWLWALTLSGVAVLALLLGWQQQMGLAGSFQSMFVLDRFGVYFKWLFLLTVAVVVVMTRGVGALLSERAGAFYLLLLKIGRAHV